MKAIPTVHCGTTFRSRLEASWAAHFDDHLMPWVYEPEGFALSDGSWYLPDFWLPTARAWAEVKGDHDERLSKVDQFATDLWAESGAHDTYDPKSPMVLLFRTPRFEPSSWRGAGDWHNGNPLGVMGPGKGYSVAFARCHCCTQTTIIALWQNFCRNCGHSCIDAGCSGPYIDPWHDSVYSGWDGRRGNPKWFQFLRPKVHP